MDLHLFLNYIIIGLSGIEIFALYVLLVLAFSEIRTIIKDKQDIPKIDPARQEKSISKIDLLISMRHRD